MMGELYNKDFKAAILKTFPRAITNVPEATGKKKKTRKVEQINRKPRQRETENLELKKNTITEIFFNPR